MSTRTLDVEIERQRCTRGSNAAVARLAARQHGVVARRQLIDLGLGAGAIDHGVRSGRLHAIHRAVYAVGHPALSREGRWMAAALACGTTAVLSHRAAAAHWGLRPPTGRAADVTTPGRWRNRPGIIVHRGRLPADEVTRLRVIPVTTVPRTLLDLAAFLKPEQVAKALREAEYRRLTDSLSLGALLERYPGRRGTRTIRALLAERAIGDSFTHSELEDRFLSFLDAHTFPRPVMNTGLWVRGRWFEVDCLWRERRLVVELDGRASHGTARGFESDRERDRALNAAGWRVIRITWRQLHAQPGDLAADLRTLIRAPAHR